jgi:sugar phosphate isomerase/epimerase
MRSAITVSLVPQARGGPFVFWDDLATACEAASRLGFDAIEVFPSSAEAVSRDGLRTSLARHSLKLAAVGTGGGWVLNKWHLLHPEAAIREQSREFIRSIIELAAEFGAPAIIGSMQGRVEGELTREGALAEIRDALNDLGAHAAARGQMLLYEPLNRYETNLFNRLGDVAEFLVTLKTTNVKILADLFHMNIEEASLPEALRAAARHLGHVHFADSNRLAIGFGHTDVAPVISALREIGYTGYLSAEVLPLPDSETAARQTIESFRLYAMEHRTSNIEPRTSNRSAPANSDI